MGRRKQVAPRNRSSTCDNDNADPLFTGGGLFLMPCNIKEEPVETGSDHTGSYQDEQDFYQAEFDLENDYVEQDEEDTASIYGKSLSCDLCGKFFKHKKSLQRHVKLHSGIRKHKCDLCDAAFVRSDHLRSHVRTHLTGKKKKDGVVEPKHVQIAEDAFPLLKKEASDSPMQDETVEDLIICPLCNLTVTSMADFVAHMSTAHTPKNGKSERDAYTSSAQNYIQHKKVMSCVVCGLNFSEEAELDQHFVLKHTKIMVQCTLCEELFDAENKECVKRHYLLKHSRESTVVCCSICQQDGLSEIELQEHIMKQHLEKKQETKPAVFRPPLLSRSCNICHRKFTSEMDVLTHQMKEHAMDQAAIAPLSGSSENDSVEPPGTRSRGHNLTCSYCGQGQRSATELQKHLQTHYSSTRLRCNICDDDVFPNEQVLEEHKHSHWRSPAAPAPGSRTCSTCRRPLSYTDSESHCAFCRNTAFRAILCPLCMQTFESTLQLRLHLMTHRSFGGAAPAEHAHRQADHSGKFMCPVCDTDFGSESELEKHRRSHLETLAKRNVNGGEIVTGGSKKIVVGGKPKKKELNWRFKCDRCPKRFLSWSDKARHRMLHHNFNNVTSCRICKKTFARKESGLLHMQKEHSELLRNGTKIHEKNERNT